MKPNSVLLIAIALCCFHHHVTGKATGLQDKAQHELEETRPSRRGSGNSTSVQGSETDLFDLFNSSSVRTNVKAPHSSICVDGRTHSSLQSCMEECINKTVSVQPLPQALPNSILDSSAGHVTHKVIVRRPHEFTIDRNGVLWSRILGSVTNSSYTTLNGTAFVCYPLAASFVKCEKWLLEPYEYEIRSNLRAWVKPYKQAYNLDEFYLTTSEPMMAICIPPNSRSVNALRILHLTGYFISAASLIVAFITSYVVPGVKKSTNRPLQCHMIMLFLGFTTVSLKYPIYKKESGAVCTIFASLQQFFFLSAFFWINSQAIDLYISLKDLRPDCHASKRRHRRFLFYCVYSWGIPMLITALTVLAEVMAHRLSILDPGFQKHCWFQIGNQISAFVFYYGWMAIIIIMNAILFLLIVRKFQQMGQQVFIANKNIHKQLLRISIKLVIVMGFFWVIKVSIWAFGWIGIVASILDIVTSLQGFFIFLVYICKPKTFTTCLVWRHKLNRSSVNSNPNSSNSNHRRARALSSFFMFTTTTAAEQFKESSFVSSPLHSKLTFAKSSSPCDF